MYILSLKFVKSLIPFFVQNDSPPKIAQGRQKNVLRYPYNHLTCFRDINLISKIIAVVTQISITEVLTEFCYFNPIILAIYPGFIRLTSFLVGKQKT